MTSYSRRQSAILRECMIDLYRDETRSSSDVVKVGNAHRSSNKIVCLDTGV